MKVQVVEQSSDESKLVGSAAAGVMFAGVVHLAIAPVHWSHSPAHGLFHLLSGLVEIVWAIAFWRKPSALSSQIGVIITGALITLWTITRFLPAPFSHEVEEIDMFGIVTKMAEGWAVITLVMLTISNEGVRQIKTSAWRIMTRSLVIAIIGGLSTYYLAIAAEPLMPWLAEQDSPHVIEQNVTTPVNQPVKRSVGNDNLQLVVGGIPSAFVNGVPIPVTGDVVAEITMTLGDVRYTRSADLYLYHQTTFKPIEDAKAEVTGRMRYMEHGTFRQIALPSGEGHYYLDLPFPMSGEWELEIVIITANKQNTIHLFTDIFN
jgi:hypothetical protein